MPTQAVLAAEQPQTREFIRARIATGAITTRVNGEASLELVTDGNKATVPIKLVNGQPVSGEVQTPFVAGSYSVRLVKSVDGGEQDLLRIRGVLTPKGQGIYEHTATETMADPATLAFGQDGAAVIVEAGSIQGSAALLLLASNQEPLSVTISLDADGDGVLSDKDIRKQQTVRGPQAVVETPSVEGLPLTSTIEVDVRDANNSQVAGIRGPYDFLTAQASAQPMQQLSQDKVKSVLVILKRVPMLTKVEIPAARLAPPSETVQVQPQSAAQNALAAFGDADGLKLLFQGVEASVTLPPETAQTPDKVKSNDTRTPSSRNGFLETITAVFNRFKDTMGIPVIIILGVILIGGLVTLIMWSVAIRQVRSL